MVDTNLNKDHQSNRLASSKEPQTKNIEIDIVDSLAPVKNAEKKDQLSSRRKKSVPQKPHINDPGMMKKIRQQEKQRIKKIKELRKKSYKFENSIEEKEQEVLPVKVELSILHTDELLGYYKEVLSKGRKDFIAHSKNHGVPLG